MQANEAECCIISALEQWQNSLYRLAFSYVHEANEAMDVVQDTAYKAIQNKEKLETKEAARAWLFKIAVNTALDHIRKNSRTTPTEILPETPVTDSYERMELTELLDLLEPKDRTVVVLKFFEDMTLAEIASVTGQNLNTVKSRLHRSILRLRLEMTEK